MNVHPLRLSIANLFRHVLRMRGRAFVEVSVKVMDCCYDSNYCVYFPAKANTSQKPQENATTPQRIY